MTSGRQFGISAQSLGGEFHKHIHQPGFDGYFKEISEALEFIVFLGLGWPS
jgi:hypothetical protein